MPKITKVTDPQKAASKPVNPAETPGNYALIAKHPNGQQETYVVINGTVEIALLDSGSFPVR